MFVTRKYSELDKKKWLSVLDVSMMSSEESGDEDELYVKPLVWRVPNVTNFFIDLDSTFMKNKSAQARRQTKQRVLSEVTSNRSAPSQFTAWAISPQ